MPSLVCHWFLSFQCLWLFCAALAAFFILRQALLSNAANDVLILIFDFWFLVTLGNVCNGSSHQPISWLSAKVWQAHMTQCTLTIASKPILVQHSCCGVSLVKWATVGSWLTSSVGWECQTIPDIFPLPLLPQDKKLQQNFGVPSLRHKVAQSDAEHVLPSKYQRTEQFALFERDMDFFSQKWFLSMLGRIPQALLIPLFMLHCFKFEKEKMTVEKLAVSWDKQLLLHIYVNIGCFCIVLLDTTP